MPRWPTLTVSCSTASTCSWPPSSWSRCSEGPPVVSRHGLQPSCPLAGGRGAGPGTGGRRMGSQGGLTHRKGSCPSPPGPLVWKGLPAVASWGAQWVCRTDGHRQRRGRLARHQRGEELRAGWGASGSCPPYRAAQPARPPHSPTPTHLGTLGGSGPTRVAGPGHPWPGGTRGSWVLWVVELSPETPVAGAGCPG